MKGMKGESRRSAASKTWMKALSEASGLGVAASSAFDEVQPQLDDLEVPVAELAPEELVDGAGGLVEAIGSEGAVDLGRGLREAGEDPAGLERSVLPTWPFERGTRRRACSGSTVSPASLARSMFMKRKRAAFQILLAKARLPSVRASQKAMSVPGEAMLASVKRTASVPKRGDDLDGVDDVALGLRHLLAVGVAHQRVDVDLAEGNRVLERARAAVGHRHVEHEVAAEHDHARDPEEEDVEAGDQKLRGIEGSEIRGDALIPVAGQPKTGERQQAGGEPGVEHVGLLRDVRPSRSARRRWASRGRR